MTDDKDDSEDFASMWNSMADGQHEFNKKKPEDFSSFPEMLSKLFGNIRTREPGEGEILCPTCEGKGASWQERKWLKFWTYETLVRCPTCNATGIVAAE